MDFYPCMIVFYYLAGGYNITHCIFFQGGWENDETVEEAAVREAVEEAGVRGELMVTSVIVNSYSHHAIQIAFYFMNQNHGILRRIFWDTTISRAKNSKMSFVQKANVKLHFLLCM